MWENKDNAIKVGDKSLIIYLAIVMTTHNCDRQMYRQMAIYSKYSIVFVQHNTAINKLWTIYKYHESQSSNIRSYAENMNRKTY